MPEKKITEIPANPVFHNIRKSRRRLRVAAYCRVSTEEEEQQNSFEVQIQYYTQKICGNPEWELAGIFADEGISGVSTRKRAQFNEMIALCKRRKIDMILTKSISRFARNTLDCIRYVRMLKSWGIRIIFEKENIDTANMNSEMILTCLSSFAQAESESISGNVTKGIRMGYRQGRFVFRYDRFLGYRKGADGKPEIVPEQAEIVRQIAQSYLNGNSLREIKRFLEDRNIPSPGGMRVWRESTILSILQNEKYMGDVLLQKSFTADFMEGKKQKNNGELPQYYIRDNHPAILSRETFYRIQEEISRRNSKRPANAKRAKTNRGRFSSKYALTERLVCGICGSLYRRVTWSIHGRKEIVWRCINRLEYGSRICGSSPTIREELLHDAIMEAMQSLIRDNQNDMAVSLQEIILQCTAQQNQGSHPEELRHRLEELNRELDRLLTFAGNDLTDLRIKQISDEMIRLRQQEKQLASCSDYARGREDEMRELITLLDDKDLNLTEYSDELVRRVIERVTVLSGEEIVIRFVGGMEMRQRVGENVGK